MTKESTKKKPSKSAAKRAAAAVQDVADRLVALPPDVRARLPLGEDLLNLVEAATRMKRGAARRARLTVAKALRSDPERCKRLVALLEADAEATAADRHRFRHVEVLRDGWLASTPSACAAVESIASERQRDELTALRRDYHAALPEHRRKAIYRDVFRRIMALTESS